MHAWVTNGRQTNPVTTGYWENGVNMYTTSSSSYVPQSCADFQAGGYVCTGIVHFTGSEGPTDSCRGYVKTDCWSNSACVWNTDQLDCVSKSYRLPCANRAKSECNSEYVTPFLLLFVGFLGLW
jgi:hypothetical protein